LSQDLLTWAFGIVGLVGVAATIYYGHKSRMLERKLQGIEIDWKDLPNAANDLANAVARDFQPDMLFSPDVRGGIVAYYIGNELGRVPSVIGICEFKASTPPLNIDLRYDTIETSNWRVHIPPGIEAVPSPDLSRRWVSGRGNRGWLRLGSVFAVWVGGWPGCRAG